MTDTDPRATLALAMYNTLERDTRNNGETFIRLKDGSPEWMTDAIRKAHGGMLPDDTRYRMIRDVLSSLTDREPDDWEDAAHEICDSLIDVYTSRLTAWLASDINRVGYVTEAIEEYGRGRDPAHEIAMGQFREYEEIYGSLVRSIEERAEEENDENEDEREG